MKINISSFSHLKNYLSTQGAKYKLIDKNSLQVTDGLILSYDKKTGYVIPTGFDNGWLFQFTNDITNLLITYLY